jgi:hypothetical protein
MPDTSLFLIKHMIIGRSASDSEYRRELLADPERMLSPRRIERDFGHTIPPGKRLKVVEETENRLYLVLPKKNAKLIVQAEMANDPVLDLIAWAMNNEAGKAALTRDAKAFIRERLGIEFDDAISIEVLEDSEDVEYIVLPLHLAQVTGDYYLAQHGTLLAVGQAHMSGGWGGGGGGGWPGGELPPIDCIGCQPNTTDQTADDCDDGIFTPGDEDCKCWSACVSGDVLTWDTADAPTDPSGPGNDPSGPHN